MRETEPFNEVAWKRTDCRTYERCGGCDACIEMQFPDYYQAGYALLKFLHLVHAPRSDAHG